MNHFVVIRQLGFSRITFGGQDVNDNEVEKVRLLIVT